MTAPRPLTWQRCRDCEHDWERFIAGDVDTTGPACPACGSGRTHAVERPSSRSDGAKVMNYGEAYGPENPWVQWLAGHEPSLLAQPAGFLAVSDDVDGWWDE